MAANVNDVYQWISTTLLGDSIITDTLGLKGVWSFGVPKNAQFPYAIIQKQTGVHTHTLGEKEAFNRHWIIVKIVDKNHGNISDGGKRARDIQTRARVLLNNKKPVLPNGGYTMIFRANTDYEYDEQESGSVNLWHIVTVYMAQLGEG